MRQRGGAGGDVLSHDMRVCMNAGYTLLKLLAVTHLLLSVRLNNQHLHCWRNIWYRLFLQYSLTEKHVQQRNYPFLKSSLTVKVQTLWGSSSSSPTLVYMKAKYWSATKNQFKSCVLLELRALNSYIHKQVNKQLIICKSTHNMD